MITQQFFQQKAELSKLVVGSHNLIDPPLLREKETGHLIYSHSLNKWKDSIAKVIEC